MRITKKMVYAKYDIEMKGDKILSPIGWITELLKEGNDKTGKRVYTWSILPGTAYIPYDKYNQSAAVNRRAETYVRSFQAAGIAVDVVCSNVLNVIAEDSIIESIAADIRRIIAGGGSAYITVYEGNRSGAGRQTGPDQWQRNERLSAYLRFFPGAEIHKGMIIVKG